MISKILLHQYDSSPFSEKVRVCLGIKRLDWGAVDEPVKGAWRYYVTLALHP